MTLADFAHSVLMHPVRLRLVQRLALLGTATVQELAARPARHSARQSLPPSAHPDRAGVSHGGGGNPGAGDGGTHLRPDG